MTTGRLLRWFPGPFGALTFNTFLFSYSDARGTAVWDVTTGERLLSDEALHPLCYHHSAHRFLSVLPDGVVQLSRLAGSPSPG